MCLLGISSACVRVCMCIVVADPSWPAPAYDADAWSRLEAVLFLPGADEGPSSHNIEYR